VRRWSARSEEHARLGAQDFRDDRLEQEVHCAELVSLEYVRVLAMVRGHEDDGRLPVALTFPDHARRLEAVHDGHLHVEQDQREVLRQEPT
jgi:hypothetical protein